MYITKRNKNLCSVLRISLILEFSPEKKKAKSKDLEEVNSCQSLTSIIITTTKK